MNDFKLDLGLERFEDIPPGKDAQYIQGGIMIEVGGETLTEFEYDDGEKSSYLGTHTVHIWENIAQSALKLENQEIQFTVMTEGWDPRYNVERVKKGKLQISITEESTQISGIKIPDKYQEGVIFKERELFTELLNSGRNLQEFLDTKNPGSEHKKLDSLIQRLEEQS